MASSAFRIGSILGFEIRVDYSWFVIFFLILWTLTAGVFPFTVPGLSRGAYLVMGLTGALLFFLSLLGHEVSHSIVARMKGIEVAGITLFIFGGMAHTKAEATTPGDEFQIAFVGPLSSLLIAGLFAAVVWVGRPAGWSPAVLSVARYLAEWNVLLAVFNLLPGFPLDGGRVFRSIVWKATGSLERATRWASTGGQLIGFGLIGYGILTGLRHGLLSGLWLVFIGWFLRNAAVSSGRQSAVMNVLSGGRAADAMTSDPETVPPGITLDRLAEDHFLHRHFSAYPVVEAGEPVGVVTIAQLKAVPRAEWPVRTAGSVMAPLSGLMVVAPDASMQSVLEAIQSSPAQRALVMDDGHLAGIVAPSDLAAWVQRVRELRG